MEQTRNCGNNGFDMYNIGDRCEYVQYAIEIERMLLADGKSTRDRRASVARECSSLDGTK